MEKMQLMHIKKIQPNLVFIDVNMPKVDGMEILHSILKFLMNQDIF